MRRLRILIAALTLAVTTWQAHALSITVDADLLKDASGNPMPTTGLVLLVASTSDATFNGPTPLSFVSGDDVIIGKWDLRASDFYTPGGEPGVLIDFTNTVTALTSANPLRLYWYPTLNINSTAPGQNTPYGTFRDIADPSQGAVATANLSGNTVGSITVNNGGATYHSTPTVTFANGGGSGATATATMSGGVVTAINVVNPGSGYTTPPDVIISVPQPVDSSQPWFGANAASSINLRFITIDANPGFHTPGSNAASTGLASSNTPTPIVINNQPANSTQSYGGTATFSVNASGASLVYQWRKNGVNLSNTGNVSGATTSSLTLSSVAAADVASYSVFITNSSSFATSSSATLTVVDPSITTQPVNATANATASASFSVVASGSGSLTYVWKKGASTLGNGAQPSGAVVSGATTSSVTLSGVQQGDAANYTVLVTGTGGTITSSAASLTVNAVAPVFSTPATDTTTTLDAGNSITLSAASTGSTPITYQWKRGVSNLTDGPHANGATVSGAATATLTLSGVMAADAGVYACNANNIGGNTLSHTTTININDPIITDQPVGFTAECGDTWPCLSVIAVGSTNLTYQWYAGATALTDETNASYCFGDTSFGSAGSYSVIVSNVYGNSITSSVATVTVIDTQGPFINVIAGHTASVCQGTAYNDSGATASDDCDGSVIVTPSGSVDTNTVGSYTITYTASDSHGNISTDTRVVTVQTCVVGDPAITSQPQSLTVLTTQKNFSMSVTVAGTPSPNPKLAGSGGFRYQWHFKNTNHTEKALPITLATNQTYLFKTAVGYGNMGTYWCVVTNAVGTVTSSNATLTVYQMPTPAGPGNQLNKIAGTVATFKCTATPAIGTNTDKGGPYTFQWTKNDAPISTGGKFVISDNGRISTLLIYNVQMPDAGTYLCTIGNSSSFTTNAPNNGAHGVLSILQDIGIPSAGILHPSTGLKTTNGLQVALPYEPNVFAPDLYIDGNATDLGYITNVALIRIEDNNTDNVALYYKTNTLGVRSPGVVKWTNHVTLLHGTNTYKVIASDSGTNNSTGLAKRQYFFFTNVPVTINVKPPGYGTISPAFTFGFKAIEGANQLPDAMGFTITANPKLSPHRIFVNWTDDQNNILGTARALKFTVTSNMVINANFQ